MVRGGFEFVECDINPFHSVTLPSGLLFPELIKLDIFICHSHDHQRQSETNISQANKASSLVLSLRETTR